MDKDHMYYKYRHEKMNKKDVGTLAEYPFFYDGMTIEEFEDEKEYYWKHTLAENHERYKTVWKPWIEQKRKEREQQE